MKNIWNYIVNWLDSLLPEAGTGFCSHCDEQLINNKCRNSCQLNQPN